MSLNLYAATVPVFQRYLQQLQLILDLAQEHLRARAQTSGAAGDAALLAQAEADLLEARLAPDMLPLRSQVQVAGGFVLRAIAPLLGRPVPAFGDYPNSLVGLQQMLSDRQSFLTELQPSQFQAMDEHRIIRSDAGQTNIELPALDFALQFALPNFFFHLTCAYAILRQQGVPLSKQDFDGLHRWR
ncbi:DUF1993 domain-containing protein [Paucibacter sp. AS339]|uniref:DUF1993 domain-containing protein n=1 Tax=Paucibacter hankyongi TaxID=3133434 RepID=UPI0030A87DA4